VPEYNTNFNHCNSSSLIRDSIARMRSEAFAQGSFDYDDSSMKSHPPTDHRVLCAPGNAQACSCLGRTAKPFWTVGGRGARGLLGLTIFSLKIEGTACREGRTRASRLHEGCALPRLYQDGRSLGIGHATGFCCQADDFRQSCDMGV
jgi:hypothetical protein